MKSNTVFLTVFSGTLVFTLGQIIQKFIIDPIQEQKNEIGKIADSLIFYANIYSNPVTTQSERHDQASEKFRQHSSLLTSKTHLIPRYKLWSFCRIVIKPEKIIKASERLLRISNNMYLGPLGANLHGPDRDNVGIRNSNDVDEIKALLNLVI